MNRCRRDSSTTQSVDEESAVNLDALENHPPGTVNLVSKLQVAGTEGKVKLVPQPSGDPNDPLGWPIWRKVCNFALLASMTTSIFSGLSMQHLFWSRMKKELHVDYTQLTRAKAAQLAAEAMACVVFIPFAKKYGRRPVYIASTMLFTAATWWSGYMTTVTELFIIDIIKGFAGAVNETAVQMSIRDMFFVHQRGRANGFYLIALTTGISFSPLAAGAQAKAYGWRASFKTLAAVMTGITALFFFLFEETKFVPAATLSTDHVYDKEAATSAEYSSGDSTLDLARQEPVKKARYPRNMRLQLVTPTNESLWRTLIEPLQACRLPHVVIIGLLYGLGLGYVVMVGSMKSIIFPEAPYNFDPEQLGLLQLGPFVGSTLAGLYGGILSDKAIIWFAKRNKGIFEPEMRLYLLPLPVVLMSAGIATFGITAGQGMHWIYPVIGSTLTSFGFNSSADLVLTVIIDAYPDIISQSFVIIAFLRNFLGMAGVLSLTPWRQNMGVIYMFVIIAVLAFTVNCLAIPLVIWGKKLRAKTAPRYYRMVRSESQ
ncbi:major facilitator superfamily transporter [Ophiocordyceps camponoti-floridani]|uniref:Major facilitator superfamily transporter n=1 Tax=Ophiocordyceps camponoti-floridani TaxID=2030778 RepID=A0A8H4VED9_9HYPO|nr:major facilitator superfamily transporter [Ophiocordyceps camponoti-floridani]